MAALLSLALVGAAVVAATPIQPNEWFNSKDHPKTAMDVANRGGLTYAIDVAPDGSAIRCRTPQDDDLGRKVCDLVMKSARFQPASDDQGRPAFAVYETVSSFLLPGKHTRPDRAKMTVPTDRLPEGVASPALAKVNFVVDAAGAIGPCMSAPEEGRRQRTVAALGPAACEHLARDYRPTAARNAAGEPVPSVQSLLIRFETR